MAGDHSAVAACLCTAALVAYIGWTSSPISDVASLLQVNLRVASSPIGGATAIGIEPANTAPTRPTGVAPLLFCWSLMQLGGYEEALIKFQLQHRSSIFACDRFAVVSAEEKHIGTIDGLDVFTWANPAKSVGRGTWGAEVDGAFQTTNSWLNTATFHRAWDMLMRSKDFWPYDFVAKVDTDSVFFPDRLKLRVQAHVGQSVYFTNCPQGGGTHLYGSIEVFSMVALRAYQERGEECKTKLPWKGWSEDFYMDNCLAMIGAQAVMDTNQVGDKNCNAAPCSDRTKVAFHPFKDLESWKQCFSMAVGK